MNQRLHHQHGTDSTAPAYRQFQMALDLALDELQADPHTDGHRPEDYKLTLCALLIELLSGLHQVSRQLVAQTRAWQWHPMLSRPGLKAGLLSVDAHQQIPLHDHPGSCGLLIALEGSVRVNQYTIMGKNSVGKGSIFRLKTHGVQQLSRGMAGTFGPETGNVHSLQALDEDCLLFDAIFSPYALEDRSFYTPITTADNGQILFATRLHKPGDSKLTSQEPSIKQGRK